MTRPTVEPGPAASALRESDGVAVVVIMPAYNAEKYLREAIGSVLGQTLTDLQLVVVDDGSTDSTLELARSTGDDRVHVISVANGGPGRARNAGVAASKPSPYLAFLDADDSWEPTKLEEQVRFLENRPDLAAVGCFMRYVSSDGTLLGQTGQAVTLTDLRRVTRGELFPFQMSSLLARRSVFESIGGFDDVFRHQGSEDLDLYVRIAQTAPIDCLPRALGSYRIHRDSTMSRHQREAIQAARFVKARTALRSRGEDLTWDEFLKIDRPTFSRRRKDLRAVLYRTAALCHAERSRFRALGYLALAFMVSPMYTTLRLLRQKGAQ